MTQNKTIEAVIKKLEDEKLTAFSSAVKHTDEYNLAIDKAISILRAAVSEVVDVNAGLVRALKDIAANPYAHSEDVNCAKQALTAYQSNPQAVSKVDDASQFAAIPMNLNEAFELLMGYFEDIWKSIEAAKHKLNAGYHFDYSSANSALNDAFGLCRPFWDKLNDFQSAIRPYLTATTAPAQDVTVPAPTNTQEIISKVREALEFYAVADNYKNTDGISICKIATDCGYKAKQALSLIKAQPVVSEGGLDTTVYLPQPPTGEPS